MYTEERLYMFCLDLSQSCSVYTENALTEGNTQSKTYGFLAAL